MPDDEDGTLLAKKHGRLFMIALLVITSSALWVYADARSIGVRKGIVSGLGDMSPLGWFIATIGLWIVAFPTYLSYRGEFKNALANPEGRAPKPIPTKLSAWSVTAFYAGLLSILIVPAPIAVFSGIMAMRDIDSNPSKGGKGRAIFGIMVGVVMTTLWVWGTLSARHPGHG